MPISQDKIRNVAIIAHVDHGKTTLVDGLLKQAHAFAQHQAEMTQTTIMDNNDLERERGVTILAKNTAVEWNGYKLNILDTPGHADFSGEVERVLNMADGCLLLVDSSEGVLSQTRYVLSLALKQGLRPIVVVNKVDRKDQRVDEVINEVTDLFLELAETEEQLEFPIVYAIGREGIAGSKLTENADHSFSIADSTTLQPLFETIVSTIPAPAGDTAGGFQMQVTSLEYDDYKGKYLVGRIRRGKVTKGQQLVLLKNVTGEKIAQFKAEYVFTYKGLAKEEVSEATVGDIIAITGYDDPHIGDTLTNVENQEALPSLGISEPTVQIQFSVSDSPFVGQDGQFTTSRQVKQRLDKELETNVGLRLAPGFTADSYIVSGRGELHLAILIETMRREGYEFSVSRPEVIFKDIDGVKSEPYELITIEVGEQHVGVVTTGMGERKATFHNMKALKNGSRFEYEISTRNLIGFRSAFQSQTSGLGVVHSLPLGYRPLGPEYENVRNGVLIAAETGQTTAYSLEKAQERGSTFVDPGTSVYAGMIVGLNAKKEDIVMNVTKGKKLTNMRASSADATVKMAPAVHMSLEQCLTFLAADELLEVTPLNLRLRKRNLAEAARH